MQQTSWVRLDLIIAITFALAGILLVNLLISPESILTVIDISSNGLLLRIILTGAVIILIALIYSLWHTMANSKLVNSYREMNAQLHRSEKRFHDIFNNSTIGIYRTTPEGHVLLANPALINMLGYSDFEDLKERNLERAGYEPLYPREEFKQKMETEKRVIGLESAWKRQDGSTLFVRESATAICDDNGNIKYYEGTVEDISDRKKYEKSLVIKNSAIESSLSAVAITTLDGRLTYVNSAFLRMWSYDLLSDVIGNPLKAFFKNRPDFAKDLDQLLSDNHLDTEMTALRQDGSSFHVHILANIVYDENNLPIRLMFSALDITESRQVMQELKNSEERFRRLTEGSPYSISILQNNKIVFINSSGASMMGTDDPSQLIGLSVFDFSLDGEREQIMERINNIIANKTKYQLSQRRIRRLDGSLIDVEIATTRFDYQGCPALQLVSRDITDQKKLEREREELIEKLQKALEEVKTLSGFIPICPSCKRVRDDIGSWQELESYLKEHSTAEFTHALCPECARHLYPDIFTDDS